MEIKPAGIVVLDEGIEESLENLNACCPSGPASLKK
jgi:putative radical SAM-modified peptide